MNGVTPESLALVGAVLGTSAGIVINIISPLPEGDFIEQAENHPWRCSLLHGVCLVVGTICGIEALRQQDSVLTFAAALAMSYGATNLVPTLYHFLRNWHN